MGIGLVSLFEGIIVFYSQNLQILANLDEVKANPFLHSSVLSLLELMKSSREDVSGDGKQLMNNFIDCMPPEELQRRQEELRRYQELEDREI